MLSRAKIVGQYVFRAECLLADYHLSVFPCEENSGAPANTLRVRLQH